MVCELLHFPLGAAGRLSSAQAHFPLRLSTNLGTAVKPLFRSLYNESKYSLSVIKSRKPATLQSWKTDIWKTRWDGRGPGERGPSLRIRSYAPGEKWSYKLTVLHVSLIFQGPLPSPEGSSGLVLPRLGVVVHLLGLQSGKGNTTFYSQATRSMVNKGHLIRAT